MSQDTSNLFATYTIPKNRIKKFFTNKEEADEIYMPELSDEAMKEIDAEMLENLYIQKRQSRQYAKNLRQT